MGTPIPAPVRFWRRVAITPWGCWLWTGVTGGSNARYGAFNPTTQARGAKVPAHRYAYELLVGPIPEGMELDHVVARGCRSKLCVNPAHLEPVTHAENRRRSRLDMCRKGLHDLTIPENCRWDENGFRRGCKACKQESAAANYARRKKEGG